MRKFLLACFLLVMFPHTPLFAQAIACIDGQKVYNGITLTIPLNDNQNAEIPSIPLVTVVGDETMIPILKVAEINEQAVCLGANAAYGAVSATLGEQAILPTSNTAFTPITDPAFNTLTIGSTQATNDRFLVLIEGQIADDDGHEYVLTLTPEQLANQTPIRVYALASDDTSDPVLTLLDDTGNIAKDANGAIITCDNTNSDTCYGGGETLDSSIVITQLNAIQGDARSAMLTFDGDNVVQDILRLRVQGGAYLLAILIGSDVVTTVAPPVAQITTLEDGAYQLTCDDQVIWSKGIPLTFPDMPQDTLYTITAIGNVGYDPVLALVDENGTGVCADDTPLASTYQLNLPTWQIPPQTTGAQLIIESPNQRVFVGGKEGVGGDVFVLIEGMSMSNMPLQRLQIETTKGMVDASSYVTTVMIAETSDLDPLLSWLNDAGEVNTDIQGASVTCDNAGIPESCYGESVSLRGSTIALAQERVLPLDSVDAQLNLPIYPDMGGQVLNIVMQKVGESDAGFVLVVQLVSN
jgi:hypothetical protein